MSIEEVKSLIDNGVQKGHDLEYKAAAALNNKEEITLAVTAFANAGGGRIIYGFASTVTGIRNTCQSGWT